MDLSIFDYTPLTPDQAVRVARIDEALSLTETSVLALPSADDEKFFRDVPVLFKALAQVIFDNAPDGAIRNSALGQVVHAHMMCMQIRTGYPKTLVSTSFASTANVLGAIGSAGLWARRAIALEGRAPATSEGIDD